MNLIRLVVYWHTGKVGKSQVDIEERALLIVGCITVGCVPKITDESRPPLVT